MKKYILLLLIITSLSSCISNKEITYLQGSPITNSEIKRINNKPYKLQIDDILNITISSKNQEIVAVFQKNNSSNNSNVGGTNGNGVGYFSDYSVDNYGNIRIPTLGEVNVLGYTEAEVRKKIETKLKEEYINNDESLFVTVKLSGLRYTVIGEINNPGTNVLFQNRVSIIEAIANSGDISELGNRKEVEIIRQTLNGTKKYTIDLTKIDALSSNVFYIKPND